MKTGQASRTAEFMALFRALESAQPAARRLFEDPFARLFLRPSLRLVVDAARIPGFGELIAWCIDRRTPGARPSGIARTRFIDDRLRAALDEGVEQVVILGAGFDCRAYRIPGIERRRVFEVDHPDTSAAKRRRLDDVLPSPLAHVSYVVTDFNQQHLSDAMTAAGYAPRRRTFFLWEGVTNYLTDVAVDATLRWFATAAPDSFVLFTYVDRRVLDRPGDFFGTTRLFKALAASGEPWTFGMDPSTVRGYLAARRLDFVEDLGAAEYRAVYWTHQFRGYEFYRIVTARVRGEEPSGKS